MVRTDTLLLRSIISLFFVSEQFIFRVPSLVLAWISAVPLVIGVLSVLVVLSWSVVHGAVLDHRCGKGTILRVMTIDRSLTDVWLMILNILCQQ